MEPVLAVLSREQCLRLMATAPIGRIIYTRHAMPAVEVVNFIVEAGDIVIRTALSGKLLAAIAGAVVAFEADDYDPVTRSGWSVTAVGHRDAADHRAASLGTRRPPVLRQDHPRAADRAVPQGSG
jgi:nitroimidazol reductase NimA-like FMN-containing flavoprotein (pyridoxamine 5'-phosphate oxidase superfamily)